MSFKTLLVSTLLAAAAVATDHGSGDGGSWGGNSGGGGGSWSSWPSGGGQAPPALAAPSCPAGCMPFPTGPAAPAETQPGQMIVQVVSVSDANGSLKYFPDKITAPVGSIVQFQYHPKNHTITESSFAEPCKPIASNLTSTTRPGLKSGFVPVTGQEPFTPVYNVLINDTKPIWIYCGQTNHCQRGMAMVINQNDSSPNTIEAYISKAAQLPVASTPPPPPSSAAPPVQAPPASSAAPPPPPPPPPESSPTFVFGGGAPPPAETASSVAAPPPPAVATVTPPSSPAVVAPATFTGAAVPGYVPQSSTGVAGLVLGALLALW
ncbi:hypothetical protein A1O7_02190 [Cladophialophora yegresii CBS 114405]|uniref:Phytocyanin domain-containing protein n=1 Tax=Cladophialophora yegresii CBS 114405 TaxID=1182544 RepID=W9W9S7_9EURO|nr:uncharacterized protein A1O7_02190 [Cladophialophora yegresii CBS 114405]EXJ61760.1 hypothetical protein A1O7_02190 [Cladophialophora yegresii CBS 114405]